MRGGRRTPVRPWEGVLVGVLLILVLAHGVRAGGSPPYAGKTATPAKRPRSLPAAGLGHIVRPGDTLWSIARRYSVSVEALRRANHLQPGQPLVVGQHLAIPGNASPGDRQEPPSLAEIVLGRPPQPQRVALSWPVNGAVASPFGPRGAAWHGGVDLKADPGTPIRAAAPGMVITSRWERAYGNVVKIWHADDLMTVYAHNRENAVKVGDWVERGQVVAIVGSTGRATAPHLHFEVRLEGRKYDPLYWLSPAGTVDVATSEPRTAPVR